MSKSILVTRPGPAGEELVQQITALGDQAILFPTIAFAEILNQDLTTLATQDWLLFISPQAVYSGVPLLRRAWPSLPDTIQFAAVGAGTAKALHDAGYQGVVFPDHIYSSEGLLALPQMQDLNNKKIAVFRGEGGRELLEQTLQARGAHVTPIIVYQRVVPTTDVTALLQQLLAQQIDMAVCSSFAAIENLKSMLGDRGWSALQTLPIIVMSERVKMLAQDLGFQTLWVTTHASNQAILDVIAEKRNT